MTELFYYICEFVFVAAKTWVTLNLIGAVAEPKRGEWTERVVKVVVAVGIAVLDVVNCSTTETLFSNMLLLISVFAICLFGKCLYRIRMGGSFAIGFLFWIIVAYIDFLVQIFFFLVLEKVFFIKQIFLQVSIERGLYLLLCTAGVLFAGKYLYRKLPAVIRNMRVSSWVVLSGIVILFLLMGYFQRVYILAVSAEYIGMWEFFGLTVLFLILFLVGKYFLSRQEQRMQLLQVKVDALTEGYHQAMESYREKATMVHDEKHHLNVLRELLVANEQEQALQYLGEVSEELSHDVHKRLTGHDFLDVILNMKLREAEQAEIKISVQFDFLSGLEMTETDICALFSNLLDNAIQANAVLPEEADRWISVTGKQQGEMLFLELQNPVRYVEGKNIEKLMVTKKDKRYHGFGMLSIKNVVEAYNGCMECEVQNDVFTQKIVLNCMKNEMDKED